MRATRVEREAGVHVVVVGCGRVGSELASALETAGHSIAVIDKDERSFRRLPNDFSGQRVVGFGFDRDHLAEAGIERAEALAAVTNGDNSNILCARIARETFGIERVVARIYDPRRALIYERLGIPTVATVAWTTDQVLRRLLPGTYAHEWIDPSGGICLTALPATPASAGKKARDLSLPGRFLLSALHRFGEGVVAGDDLVVQDGDVLYFTAAVDAVDELGAFLENPEEAH